jgi:alpha-tubulin suppressor-like RCC1 family protein
VLAPALVVAALGCREDAEPPTAPESALAVTPALTLRFRQVTAGEEHTCGVTTGNVTYCWGWNTVGELGIGTDTGPETCSDLPCSTRPVRVVGGLAFRQVSAEGGSHTCGVTTDHRLYCWGLNHLGQLGDGTGTDSPRPVWVAPRLAFRQVSAGSIHTCGVTTNNVAYCWGHNQAGALGNGTTISSLRPVRVARRLAFREVSAGTQFTCGVTTDNVAYCWGLNFGQLGNGTATGPESCFTGDGFNACSTKPIQVARRLAFGHVDAGADHTCGVTTDDVAYCWGANSAGQLGDGTTNGRLKPVRVARRLAFRQVSAGEQHTCGVTVEDVVYCWGLNLLGELGIGTDTGPEICPFFDAPCGTRPVRVGGGLAFREVSAEGSVHMCGVTTAKLAYCWGINSVGQLGDGTTQTRLRPRRVAGST